MTSVNYYCNHCGHRFQGEDREGFECPKCFWSSSVQKDDGSSPALSSTPSAVKGTSPRMTMPSWLLPSLLVVAVAVGLAVFAFSVRKSGVLDKVQNIDFKPQFSLGKHKNPEIPSATPAQPSVSADPALMGLNEEEKKILLTPLEVAVPASLSPEEEKIISQFAEFRTGFKESLPSQPWTLQNFEEMIKEQENFYKVPLPGSYRRKLRSLFESSYLLGKTAFEQDDLLLARNHWVDSLNFPMYSNKVERHRGVALTMLKPFISDTLSKIGAINSTLLEKNIRQKEQSVSENYKTLVDKLKAHAWVESASLIVSIYQLLTELENPQQIAGKAPPYPASIAAIDQGIRDSLMDLLEVPPPPVTAFDGLRKDLADKTRIVNSFIPERVEEMKRFYEKGMEGIAQKDWKSAETEFRKILFPDALVKDAAAKLGILRKLQTPLAEKTTNRGTV